MIPTNYYYLLVDLLCLSGPFLLSFQKRLPFFKYWKALFAGTIAMMLVYVPWDIYFTANGIWGFNSNYITGAHLGNLPIEEWLFFICIPYACIFSYECIRYFFPRQPLKNSSVYISGIYIAFCLIFIATKFGHWYTNSAAIVSIILLVYHSFIKRSDFMGYFHLSWWILLIPFYIANGVLTGLDFYKYPFINLHPEKISDQIVWYNNEHNLGIRIWSVPLDDFFYGMAMVLLALTVYEKLVKRQTKLV
jgi:lycopene cyclase domain-containing protein